MHENPGNFGFDTDRLSRTLLTAADQSWGKPETDQAPDLISNVAALLGLMQNLLNERGQDLETIAPAKRSRELADFLHRWADEITAQGPNLMLPLAESAKELSLAPVVLHVRPISSDVSFIHHEHEYQGSFHKKGKVILAYAAGLTMAKLARGLNPWMSASEIAGLSAEQEDKYSDESIHNLFIKLKETGLLEINKKNGYRLNCDPWKLASALNSNKPASVEVVGFDTWRQEHKFPRLMEQNEANFLIKLNGHLRSGKYKAADDPLDMEALIDATGLHRTTIYKLLQHLQKGGFTSYAKGKKIKAGDFDTERLGETADRLSTLISVKPVLIYPRNITDRRMINNRELCTPLEVREIATPASERLAPLSQLTVNGATPTKRVETVVFQTPSAELTGLRADQITTFLTEKKPIKELLGALRYPWQKQFWYITKKLGTNPPASFPAADLHNYHTGFNSQTIDWQPFINLGLTESARKPINPLLTNAGALVAVLYANPQINQLLSKAESPQTALKVLTMHLAHLITKRRRKMGKISFKNQREMAYHDRCLSNLNECDLLCPCPDCARYYQEHPPKDLRQR
ncbi:hypothetical protein MUP32_00825 [Candidatus Microgenomates bacterium]|nr:hypothetical protein [Candidatus Microgenomates bacterium]